MASLYDSASLVMIPSGVKEDKLYSIKPTDGSGDFTFSRDADIEATRVNSSGLIEKAKVNLLLQSNTFDTTWETTLSTITGGQIGYDGNNNAWLLNKTAGSGRVVQNNSQSGVYTFSVYAKQGSLDGMRLLLPAGTTADVYFDLGNGTIGNNVASIDAKIEGVGGGWYRCSVTQNDAALTNVRIYPSDPTGLTSATGSIYIQDAQLNHGLIAQDYVETTTTAVVEGLTADLPRLDYSGGASCPSLLLEPSRTNLMPNSEYLEDSEWGALGVTLDVNNTTSPEGVSNAYKITDDTSTGYHKITESNLFTADGTMRSWSVFVKKGTARYCAISHASVFSADVNSLIFDMEDGVYTNEGDTDYFDIVHDPINMSDGWWRIGFSSDINSGSYDNFSIGISQGATWSGNLSYTGDGSLNFYAYGAQLEAGSYPTSYIPTYGEATNRGEDLAAVGSSDLISTQAFTMFFEHKAFGIDGTSWAYRLDMLDGSDEIEFYVNSGAGMNIYLGGNGGYIFGSSSNDGYTAGSTSKVALSYDGDRLAYFINGSLYDSTTSVSFNDVDTTLVLQGSRNITNKQSLLFPTALTDAECIALTTI